MRRPWGNCNHHPRAPRRVGSAQMSVSAESASDDAMDIPGLTPQLRARLERLSPEKRQLAIDRLRQAAGNQAPSAAADPLVRVDRNQALPLSFAQERLWVLHEMDRGDAAYNISAALLLTGDLHVPALQRALGEIVQRHETLRTSFHVEDDTVVQKIGSGQDLEIPVEDLTHLEDGDRLPEARQRAKQELEKPFDLRTGPVLRTRILRLDPAHHVLLLTVHHIVADGWSMGLLVSELQTLYRAIVAGALLPPHEPSLEYADYASWQRQMLQAGELETESRYWQDQLRGAPTTLDLPTDRHRPPVRSGRGGIIRFDLEPPLSSQLDLLAGEVGATRYMILLSAFATLLHRLSNQDDVTIGSPMSGRIRPEFETMVGIFVNTLPVRCQLAGNLTFRELVGNVARTVVAVTSHQQLPFEQLVEAVQPDRNPSHTPIFQVAFGYQEDPPAMVDLPGLDVSVLEIDGTTSKYDLTLLIERRGDALKGVLEYSADLFRPDTARRYALCLQHVIGAVVESPDVRLDDIPLLTTDDESEIFDEWCGTTTVFPRDRSIQQLFEEQALRRADSPALVSDHGSLDYGELNERANTLAHILIERGVLPGTPVGICMRRSVDLIVGMLAILKSGGAYVPLDPEYPSERLSFMMEDARIRALLTHGDTMSHIEKADMPARIDVLSIDRLERAGRTGNPETATSPEQVAYIMYTSGSTGEPKGADIPHRAVVRLVRGTDYIDFTAAEIFLQFAPVCFDASTLEIWGALLNGGRLVIPPPQALSLDQLGEQISQHGVTTLWLTSGLFNLMVDERIQDLRSLRHLLAGGDVLSVPHVQKALEGLPDTRLINGYGPTENTTFTCCYTIPPQDWTGRSIPIGRPISNTRVYIVDQNLRLVPPGVPGELLTGGDGLFLGYRNHADLSQQALIQDPFSGDPAARLYRTGDRARYLEDGTIEFLGRLDDQLKIRGFRVEPGEIESVLTGHPQVRECIVIPRQEFTDKELAAYVVRETDPSGSQWKDRELIDRLREELDQQLPPHLVPAYLTVIEVLPLTHNGKVDRERLPAPVALATVEDAPPSSATQRRLAQIWQEVLGRAIGSIDASFFDVGGNSLRATQVVSRVRKHFELDMPIHDLFRHATIRALSAHIDRLAAGQPLPSSPATARIEKADQAPELSFAQERLWFLYRLEPDNPFYNVAFAHRISGCLDIMALEASFNALIERHEILRTCFVERDGQAQAQLLQHVDTPILVQDLRHADSIGDEILNRASEEARTVFDLGQAPLLRAKLLITGTDAHVLLVTMHHIVSDGWSLGVLVRELVGHYKHLTTDQPVHLPELSIQYADFAAWQRAWFTGHEAAAQLAHWREHLRDFPAELSLPTDRSRPPAQSFRGSSVRFLVDTETTDRLRHLCQQTDATMYMVLLAAFNLLLYRYTNQEDIVVGSPIANRNRDDVESLIGFFVNTLALRTDLSGDPPFRELVARVRRVCLDAFAHQDYPFEKLVDTLQPERDLSRNPLFQVMFALQNAPEEDLAMPGLSFSSLDLKRTAAQFDIVLDMWENDQGLLGIFEFSTDLFDESTIQRMSGHFITLLARIGDHDSARLAELSLIDANEEHRLLVEFAGPQRSYPLDRTLHDLFEQNVRRHPDRVAASHDGVTISYAGLDSRANQIAWSLRAKDLQPNQFVAILEPRGIDFLAAMLGILKAGGAFIPMEAQYPEDRIRHMLKDSQVDHLITRSNFLEHHQWAAKGDSPLQLVLLDAERLGDCPTHDPDHVSTPRDPAYMLYTSGSTGSPRGAMVRHDGAVNHIFAEFDLLEFHADTAFLQSAPASSDISVWQFLSPLLKGGRTVIADYETVCDPVQLLRLIQAEGITLIELVPVLLQELLTHARTLPAPERSLPDLEWAMVTGEAVPVPVVNLWLDTYPDVRVVNAYGPTEAADDTCQHVLSAKLPADRRSVPIGTPIPNMTHYVLDAQLNLVPIGVPGEICVSGVGVGLGYWQDEKHTRDRFVLNPHRPAGTAGEHHAVLYRTGDRGLWRPDGTLEYVERFDTQVKIRGFRIELGEIESILTDHPMVREAAVAVHEDESGERRLSAYCVPELTSAPTQEALASLREEQIRLWKQLHENSYQSAPADHDPTFNTIGWDSNYTGAPLPTPDMEQYVRHTVERIRSLNPGRLLEIGCGTGLLMFPLLPHCDSYTGTDLSAVAIEQLISLQTRPELRARTPGLEGATLMRRPAHDLAGFEPDSFDSVVLASVVQYFPGIQYLVQVLESLMPLLSEGGSIFVGDVRALGLLESFHASVQLFKGENDDSTADLLTRSMQRVDTEQELAIDPEFFLSLARRLKRISHVEILPKRGKTQNEMTRFRYDVLIHLDQERPEIPDVAWHDWGHDEHSVDGLAALLRREQPALLAVHGIRNARVEEARRSLHLMHSCQTHPDKSSLVAALSLLETSAIEPEDLWSLEADLPYTVLLSMARSGEDGSLDALLVRTETGHGERPLFAMPIPEQGRADVHCASNPLQEQLAQRMHPQLRQWLRDRLPNYMVPSDFILRSSMPVTPAGKIDRDALPAPVGGPTMNTADRRPPSTAAERRLAEIWTEVLGIESPDIGANFFDLGGHSLRATQVASRIRRDFGVEIPLRELFDLPTIDELAARLQEMETGETDEITPVEGAADYPLSHAQRRLWILSQIEATSSAYNMPASLVLDGPLDRRALTHSLEEAVGRHESLQTRFTLVDDGPRQRIDAPAETISQWVDLSSEADPEARARELALRHAAEPFDLAQGPVLRLSVLKLAPERHVLLFNMHHIVGDEWSLKILVADIGTLYEAICRDLPPQLHSLRIQYKDYACWQTDRLTAGDEETARAFWLSQFQQEPDALQLPTDMPRPAIKTYGGHTVTHWLGAETTDKLRAFGQQCGASLFMGLVACVNVLLHRHTGQQDITVGLPTAGRSHTDLEGLVGYFINTLPLRLRIDPTGSLQDFLCLTSERVTACLEHQMYPVDRVIDELNLQRDPSRNPLFDVTVTLQNVESYELSLPGISVSPFVEDYDMSKFDLSFSFEEAGSDLRLDITYNSDLFLPDRVARMAHQYERIVRGLLQDPLQSVAQLDILPPTERQQALQWCDRPVVEPSTTPTLPAWFEHQASLNPDRIAVVDSGAETRQLTYAELNEQANRLARSLRTRGVQTGERVGLYMDRGVDVVVSILGILKAGAAYVPLDPMYPAERVRFMIQDAELSHLVTQADLVTQIDVGAVEILDLAEDAHAILACSSGNLGAHAHSHDPAYVIYTSGSTGQPKGVVVTHANVTRLFHSTRNLFDFSNSDVWTLFHSYSFDFSVWEIWGALLYGGRLVVVPQELSRSPGDLLDLLAREKVTVLNQTPSAFHQLITADTDTDSAHELALRYVIFGGEALDCERLRPWFDRRGDSHPELVNMYGITETTVHVTYRPIRLSDLDQRASLIGPPLPDLRLYIVDDHGQPSPLGVPGEIWVGGDGVAQGYLHREQLTSEKFTIDPFRPGGQDRVYRSGDLGRLRPDGDIEYLGRIDSQVQVRGFRVELGEIEARLAMHPLVREAIVIADQQEPATRLVSYCLTATSQRPGLSDLRRFLTSHLPAYMVPSHFVFLDAFPLTINGKLDRARLPAPDGVTDPEKVYVAATNQTERMIAVAFANVLGVEQVSRDGNFFDLGAHSMSIITVHRQLQQEHGVELSIITFYEYPTVASLAMHLSSEEQEDDDGREVTDRAALRLRARRRRRG